MNCASTMPAKANTNWMSVRLYPGAHGITEEDEDDGAERRGRDDDGELEDGIDRLPPPEAVARQCVGSGDGDDKGEPRGHGGGHEAQLDGEQHPLGRPGGEHRRPVEEVEERRDQQSVDDEHREGAHDGPYAETARRRPYFVTQSAGSVYSPPTGFSSPM